MQAIPHCTPLSIKESTLCSIPSSHSLLSFSKYYQVSAMCWELCDVGGAEGKCPWCQAPSSCFGLECLLLQVAQDRGWWCWEDWGGTYVHARWKNGAREREEVSEKASETRRHFNIPREGRSEVADLKREIMQMHKGKVGLVCLGPSGKPQERLVCVALHTD